MKVIKRKDATKQIRKIGELLFQKMEEVGLPIKPGQGDIKTLKDVEEIAKTIEDIFWREVSRRYSIIDGETMEEKYTNIWELFIPLCLYFFQGKDEVIPRLLNKKYGDILRQQDILQLVKGEIEEKEVEFIVPIVVKIFDYRSLIHFFNRRGENLYKSNKYKHYKKDHPNIRQNKNGWKLILKHLYGDRRKYLAEINECLNGYIEDKGIWKESDQDGISRNFLDCDSGDINVEKILRTIVIYILRGYCSFYVGETLFGMDINWAKKSLSDFLQALYLTKRWHSCYFNEELHKHIQIYDFDKIWKNSGSKSIGLIFKSCIEKIRDGKNNKACHAYIIWWLFILIDILRGNVYKKIFDTENAFDCYCNAMRVYEKVAGKYFEKIEGFFKEIEKYDADLNEQLLLEIDNLSCKTLAKACREKAKIYFEEGHFLDSLKWHLKCLQNLLLIGLSKIGNNYQKEAVKLYLDIKKVIERLNFEKGESIFKKAHIRVYFEKSKDTQNYFDKAKKEFPNEREILDEERFLNEFIENKITPIYPERFRNTIADEYKHILVYVLVRIGFLLHLLKEKVLVPHLERLPENLKNKYEKWEKLLNERNKNYILSFLKPIDSRFETSLGCYWQNLYHSASFLLHDFTEEIERLFASEAFNKFKEAQPQDEFGRMACEIGLILMQSIDDLVNIPKKLQSFFIRDGYKIRAKNLRGEDGVLNKLVILRRWQSFNPKIPRPKMQRVPGGGYLLLWQGKGIVIDPGYDFIQNLYDEGFSIEDIDAILITHSHPDHDNELSTFLTMLHEWNRWHQKNLRQEKVKKIDLFLNEGTYRKYHNWLYSPTHVVSKVYQLQLNVWDIENIKEWKRRGKNIRIDLRGDSGYSLAIEVIPAWHDEVIAQHSAIGVKLYLYKKGKEEKEKLEFTIGITGDTYGYERIEDYYKDCDILIAHLGDVKLREIRTLIDEPISPRILKLFFDNEYSPQKVKKFLEFIVRFDLSDLEMLEENEIKILKDYLFENGGRISDKKIKTIIKKVFNQINEEFEYKNHLGLKGLYKLHKEICKHNKDENIDRLFIIGELPEELASFRQMVARWLNNMEYNKCKQNHLDEKLYPKVKVRCFTGDIGLHIGLGIERGTKEAVETRPIMIRCHRCMHNNEIVKKKLNYHPVNKIQETIVKREGARIVYLCSTYCHAIVPLYKPSYFLSYLFSLLK